jgi:hypothetical protein
MVLHALAALAVLGGVYRSFSVSGDLRHLVMIEYLLWAIFFELLVLTCREK